MLTIRWQDPLVWEAFTLISAIDRAITIVLGYSLGLRLHYLLLILLL